MRSAVVAEMRYWWLLGIILLSLGLFHAQGESLTNSPPAKPDILLECPLTWADIAEEQASLPDFISKLKYDGYIAGGEMGNIAYAKECLKGLKTVDAKIESYVNKRSKNDAKKPQEECRNENLARLRQALTSLRKKYAYGTYWVLLHQPQISKPELAWLRVLDYIDREHPVASQPESFTLNQIR